MIKPLNHHYSMESPASIYDEEAMTALELAGRTTAKVNEVVKSQNELVAGMDARVNAEVEKHLANGDFDRAIDHYVGGMEQKMADLETTVENELETTKKDIATQTQVELANLETQLQGDIDTVSSQVANIVANASGTENNAELIDIRTGADAVNYSSAGEAVRTQMGKKYPHDSVFTQVYIMGQGRLKFYEVKDKEIYFDFSQGVVSRVHHATTLWEFANLVKEPSPSGNLCYKIPDCYSLVFHKNGTGTSGLLIVHRDNVDPINHIPLLENVGGEVVGGMWHYLVMDYQNAHGKAVKQQVYITESHGAITLLEKESDNLYVKWNTMLAIRCGAFATLSIGAALEAVGDYACVAPSGETAIRIPAGYNLVYDCYDQAQLRIVAREAFNPVEQVNLLAQVNGNPIGGALMPYVLRYENQRYTDTVANSVGDIDSGFITTVRDIQTPETLSFVWASDTHYGVGCDKEGITRLANVGDGVKANFITITGDVLHGYYDLATQKNDLAEVVASLSKGRTPYLLTMGNHDDNTWYASGNGSNPETSGLSEVMTPDKFHNYTVNRNDSGVVVDPANPWGGWYYKDFDHAKIRVICLNPEDFPYGEKDGKITYNGMYQFAYRQDQLNWLANTALKFTEDGWGVIILQHVDYAGFNVSEVQINGGLVEQILRAYQTKSTGTATGNQVDFIVNVGYDFTDNASNEYIANFAGHIHKDTVNVRYDVPHITTINSGTNNGGCDVVTINRETRKITMHRYGEKPLPDYNRTVTY